jgi:threonylcarbamoyladenosine tRNA methylthiotransferase MtaB
MREQSAAAGLFLGGDRQHLRGDGGGGSSGAASYSAGAPRAARAKIIVTGCAAQIDQPASPAWTGRSVIGNQKSSKPRPSPGSASTAASVSGQRHHVGARDRLASYRGFRHARGPCVQIQNGCDHRCTFCLIPFGRGPSRSVPAGGVMAQARRLAEKRAMRRSVLTGVDITAYGKDLPAR